MADSDNREISKNNDLYTIEKQELEKKISELKKIKDEIWKGNQIYCSDSYKLW